MSSSELPAPFAQSPLSGAFPDPFGTLTNTGGASKRGHSPSPVGARKLATANSLDTEYRGPVIPPHTDFRTLILCFDGTGDQFDDDNSNIVQLFSMLKKGDTTQQMVYYQAGIGTYTIPQIATPLYSSISKTLDMMIASNLNHHVMGGYEFLMQNYKEGDKICIFGFSRGAYTARALAGMVHKVGLLPACNHQQVPFAYRMYLCDDEQGWQQSVLFKKTFSMDVDIEFVGVWDTVASVGLIPRRIPFTKSNVAIRTFRHAISLDEHRAKFKANLYQKLNEEEEKRDVAACKHKAKREKRGLKLMGINVNIGSIGGRKDGVKSPPSKAGTPRVEAVCEDEHTKEGDAQDTLRIDTSKLTSKTLLGDFVKRINESDEPDDHRRRRLELQYTDRSKPTDVLEVWFAGCHCGHLARIPLRWMIRQCFLARTGIQFEADKLWEVGLDPNSLYPVVLPRAPALSTGPGAAHGHTHSRMTSTARTLVPGSGGADDNGSLGSGSDEGWMVEEEEELHDALSPIYDQLKISRAWWILEMFPGHNRVQEEDGTWKKTLGINLGRPRVVPQQEKHGIKVHRSVKMRMEATDLKYKPKVKFDVEPEWVD